MRVRLLGFPLNFATSFGTLGKFPNLPDQIRSDQISRSVVSDSLRPHESQHARPPCPELICKVGTVAALTYVIGILVFTDSVMPFNHLILCCSFLLLPSIFPSIRVFSNESVLHQYFGEIGQGIGASASASVPPMNIQD